MNETQTPTALEVIAACIASGRGEEAREPEQVAAAEGSEGDAAASGRLAAPGQQRGDVGLEP